MAEARSRSPPTKFCCRRSLLPQKMDEWALRDRRLLSKSCCVGHGEAPAIRRQTASYKYMRDWAFCNGKSLHKLRLRNRHIGRVRICIYRYILHNVAQRVQIGLELLEHFTWHLVEAIVLHIHVFQFPQSSPSFEQPIAGEQLEKLHRINND